MATSTLPAPTSGAPPSTAPSSPSSGAPSGGWGGDTGSTSTGSGSGDGGFSDIGKSLSDAWDAAQSELGAEPVPGGEEGTPSGQPTETPIEIPLGEEPTQPVVQPSDQAQAQPKPGDVNQTAPYPLSQDGKSHLVPKAELPSLLTARDYHAQLSPIFANVQDAQLAYLQASDLRVMSNDILDGSDPALRGVLNHLAGFNHSQNPQISQRYAQSFARMTQMAPDLLRQVNPTAYEGLVQSMLTRAVDMAYQRAATTQNPKDLEDAQALDWGVTGDFKKELPKADPEAQAREQFQQQQRDFAQRQQVAENRDVTAFNSGYRDPATGKLTGGVEGAKFDRLSVELDKLLKPVKDRYSDTAYSDLKAGIQRDLIDKFKDPNDPILSSWWLEHEQTFRGLISDFRTTWRQGSPGQGLQPRIQSYISDFLSKATRLLPSLAKARIESARPRTANGQFRTNGTTQPASTRTQPASPNGTTNGANGNGTPPANGNANGKSRRDLMEEDVARTFAAFRT